MRKFGVLLFALSLPLVLSAQDNMFQTSSLAQKNILNHLDVGVNVGTLGFGIDVAAPIGDYVRVRAGYNYMPRFTINSNFNVETRNGSIKKLIEKVGKIDEKLAEYGIDINDEAFAEYKEMFEKFRNVEAKDYVTMGLKPNIHQFKFLVDVMPFKNNKHWNLTAGFFVGNSTVGDACNLEKETLILEGINLYNSVYAKYPKEGIKGTFLYKPDDPETAKNDPFFKYGMAGFNLGTFADGDRAMMVPGEDNTVRAEMKVNKFRPYLGLGYNTHLSKDKKWNLNVDAGILFLCGKPKIYVDNIYKFDASPLVLNDDNETIGKDIYVSGSGLDIRSFDGGHNWNYYYYGEIVRYYWDGTTEKYIDCCNIQNRVDLVHDLHDIPGKVGNMVNTISKFKVYPNLSVTFSYRLF